MLALGGEGIFVSPIRLPSRIVSSDNPQLKQTLTTLRESQMDKFILHSMKKDVVKTVIEAVKYYNFNIQSHLYYRSPVSSESIL